jgi:hypothetical protein
MRWLRRDFPELTKLARLTPVYKLELAGLLVASARLELNLDINKGIGRLLSGISARLESVVESLTTNNS